MAKPDSYRAPGTVAAIEAETGRTGNDYRALVCVFLFGGNDSHNMIIPRDGSANRIHYDLQRGTLAITAGTELPLTPEWGVNPVMPNVKSIYDAGKLGVLMNVGVLAKPTTRAQYKSNGVTLPVQLYAHNSQQALWQSLPFLMQTPSSGYMGRTDDLVGEFFNISAVDDINGMFSISGRPLQMQGYEAKSNDLGTAGPTSATASTALAPAQYLGPARTRQSWNNKRQALFASAVASSVAKQAAITTNLQALPAPIVTTFTGLSTANGNLGAQFAMVARLLLSRSNMGHRRDTFFVSISGWDDHDGLATNYGPRLAQLDAALGAFWTALGQLGLQENVTTYTQSDFGRALKQNNDGSDHGWGGHALIMGGAVQGGQLFGTPPDFSTGSVNDADQGRMIPTTSADQYVASMLKWWGVPESQLELVLPNLVNFPVKTLPIMEEPEALIAQPKAYSIDLVQRLLSNQGLPADVTYSRQLNSVCSQFDRDGNMIPSPTNAIPNSEFAGGENFIGARQVGGHINGWNASTGNTGLTLEVTEIGVENGMRYTEWNLKGTVVGQAAYSQVGFAPFATVAGCPVTTVGDTWTFFVKARRVAEKSPMPVSWSANIRATSSVGGAIAGHDLSSTLALSPSLGAAASDNYIQFDRALTVTDAAATRLTPRFMLSGVAVGTVIDDTIRLYEPILIPGVWERPPVYLPTTGTPRALPRLDFDPANGRVRGLMREGARTNVIRNSILSGGTPGVPGTLPTNMGRFAQPGLTVAVGNKRVVNGITVYPVRIFGKATAVDTSRLDFDTVAATVVPNEDWVGSVFARLVSGSTNGFSEFVVETVGMNSSGVFVESGKGSMLGITTEKVSAQRWFAGMQFLNATVALTKLRFLWAAPVGVYVDLTIEFGAPQLEKGRQASSWIPTGPTANFTNGIAAQRYIEVCEVSNGFSGWYNPVQGSLVVKAETQVGQAGTRTSWPRVSGFTVLAGSNTSHMQDNFGVYAVTSPDPALNGRSGSSVSNAYVASGDNSISTPVVANGKPATRAISYSSGFLQTSHRGVVTTAGVPTAFPAVTRLQIGLGLDAAPVWVQSIDYYATKLTPTELAAVTSG